MGKTARLHLSTRSTPEAVQYGPCPRIRLAPELQPLGREGRLAGRMRRPDIGIGEAHKKGPVLSAQRADREARRAGTQKPSPVAGALQELQGATERCLRRACTDAGHGLGYLLMEGEGGHGGGEERGWRREEGGGGNGVAVRMGCGGRGGV